MNRAQRTVLAASIFALAATAQAGIITYNSQAAFLAAISAPGVDTYDDLAIAAGPNTYNRTAGAYSYTATDLDGDFFPAGSGTDHWLSTNVATDRIQFSAFSTGVIGVGGFFFGSDINGAFLAGQSVTVTADDGSTVSSTLTNTTLGTFLGFTTDGSFTAVVVSAGSQEQGTHWPTVNDLTLGVAPDNGGAVPEPATLALLGLGLAGLAASRRRTLA